ncbi:MAG: SDR family oxidoreductase [Beijerinckiaceae bacterium]
MTAIYRTALVTGASSGIGRAVAVRLRRAGMQVLALGRSAEALQSLTAEHDVTPIVADVRQTGSIADLFARREIDVLVNNAGLLSTRAAFQDIAHLDIDEMIDVNLKAPLHLARLALPNMIAQRRGHLFFIGSIAGRWPHPNSAVYGASKAGVSLFCDSLRCDLLGTGVRVTEIAPGRVETQLYRTALGPQRAQAELYDGYRTMSPEDVADILEAALSMPAHVDVSRIEVLPTSQAVGGGRIVKDHGS